MTQLDTLAISPLRLGPVTITSRLIVGTGKYVNYEIMQQALDASGAEVVTVAVRRERLMDSEGRSLLDFLDTDRYTILPNTAGCFNAQDAVRVARLGREILDQLNNAGKDWVKLEVLGDKRTLLPDPIGTLDACRELVADGFSVLCYTSDDPIMALRLRDAGATSVMPAGSLIGSGRGIANPAAISMILEMLQERDVETQRRRDEVSDASSHSVSSSLRLSVSSSSYPVIIDAGVGTPSDVTLAMELGADGVLLNTGIAHAKDPVKMAQAMRYGLEAGRLAYESGRIPKKRYATASSPFEGVITYIPGE